MLDYITGGYRYKKNMQRKAQLIKKRVFFQYRAQKWIYIFTDGRGIQLKDYFQRYFF
jgi:hypothetical protein